MRRARLALAVLLLLAGACAKQIPVPVVSSATYPDFVMPALPVGSEGSPAAIAEDRGWRFLQAGDLTNASRELASALESLPGFLPADTALGYVELAGSDPNTALGRFDRILQQQPDYASALAGRGEALLALDRDADAIAAFEAAAQADASLTDLRRRIDVLKFQSLQNSLARARESAAAGRTDEAIAAYTGALASSPDSSYLYRELAIVESQKGDSEAALQHFRKAVSLDLSDAESLEQIGDILAARNDLEGAAAAYKAANALEPSADLPRKIGEVRAKAELARLPEQYRAIADARQITRADLAALIGVRLEPLLQSQQGGAVVITDVGSSWALKWIMEVARAGVMEPFDNHAFQPASIVRRSDLAQVAARLLSRIAAANPAQGQAWESARGRFDDLAPGHLAYPAASVSVAAGVMRTENNDLFDPSRPVTGEEALDAVAKLEALAGSQGRDGNRRP